MPMQTIILLTIRAVSVIFGLFDVMGILWASGLSKSWIEFLWWWTPAISLILGGVLSKNVIKILHVRLFLIVLSSLGILYSLHRIDVSWNSPGIDSTSNLVRFFLVVFVMLRFIFPFFINARESNSRKELRKELGKS
jgi:hypothetical protein